MRRQPDEINGVPGGPLWKRPMNEPELIRKVLAALLEESEDRSTMGASEILDALRPYLNEGELAHLVLCGIDHLTNTATLEARNPE